MAKTNRIDIVYVLSNESRWIDKEIMYSIRSVEKFIKGYGKIFIVGRKPMFFNDKVIEIPYEDIFTNKARNIKCKILRAAVDRRVSNNFMLLNDDYFFLQPIEEPGNYPYYYKCDLKETIRRNRHNLDYLPHVMATEEVLRNLALPRKNFDTHYPIIYNKKKLCEVCDKFLWNVSYGFIFKSVYCNTLGIKGVQREDCKINHPHVRSNWPIITKELECFSIGDRSINASLEQFLSGLFPKPSRYEILGWPNHNQRANI